MGVKQTNLLGGAFEVLGSDQEPIRVGGKCDVRCLRAAKPRCVCQCGGRNHGALNHARDARLDGEAQHYIWLGHIPEIVRMFEGYVCPSCGTSFKTADLLGYEHPDGVLVEQYEMKLWVFARCARCGYDTAWWKLGRALVTMEAGWR